MQTQDITKLELRDLEALGYRVIKDLELARQNLAVIESEIQKRQQQQLVEKPIED